EAEANDKVSVVDRLIEHGIVSLEDVTRALAAQANMDFVDLSQLTISNEVIHMIDANVARRYKVVPVAQVDSGLMVAIGDPLDFDTFDSLGYLLKQHIEFVCATPAQIKTALHKYYGTADEAVEALENQLGDEISIG